MDLEHLSKSSGKAHSGPLDSALDANSKAAAAPADILAQDATSSGQCLLSGSASVQSARMQRPIFADL